MRPGLIRPGNRNVASVQAIAECGFNEARADSPGKSPAFGAASELLVALQ